MHSLKVNIQKHTHMDFQLSFGYLIMKKQCLFCFFPFYTQKLDRLNFDYPVFTERGVGFLLEPV